MHAKLSDSFIWHHLNGDGTLVDKMMTIIKEGEHVKGDRIPTALLAFKNRLKSPLTNKILEELNDGGIELLYHPDIKFPLYMPFFLMAQGPHSVKGYVVINNMDTSNNGSEITLDARKMKVALEACYMAISMHRLGESVKLRGTTMIKSGSKIYSSIVTECINRKHAIKMDVNVYNSLLYLSSKFFIVNILGANNLQEETLRNYCLYNCKQPDYTYIRRIDDQFEDEDYADISKFIGKISNIPEFRNRLGNLTVGGYIQSYINSFDSSMLLSMENFNYLMYNIIAVNESTFINNYTVLKNIVSDDGRKLYSDIVVSIC